MSRITEIGARLAEIHPRTGQQMWHENGCPYFDEFECDCMRSDLELLFARVVRSRCESRKVENAGKRRWRCDREAGHDGQHRSASGRRRW